MKTHQWRGHALIEPYIAMVLFVLGVLCASRAMGLVYPVVASWCEDAGEPLRSFPQFTALVVSAVAALVALLLPVLVLAGCIETWQRFSRALTDFRSHREERS